MPFRGKNSNGIMYMRSGTVRKTPSIFNENHLFSLTMLSCGIKVGKTTNKLICIAYLTKGRREVAAPPPQRRRQSAAARTGSWWFRRRWLVKSQQDSAAGSAATQDISVNKAISLGYTHSHHSKTQKTLSLV